MPVTVALRTTYRHLQRLAITYGRLAHDHDCLTDDETAAIMRFMRRPSPADAQQYRGMLMSPTLVRSYLAHIFRKNYFSNASDALGDALTLLRAIKQRMKLIPLNTQSVHRSENIEVVVTTTHNTEYSSSKGATFGTSQEFYSFKFDYCVKINNLSDTETYQLVARQWKFTDERGRTDIVSGEGVIGKQPIIGPRASFEYNSHITLRTPAGRMLGTYLMRNCRTGEKLDAEIGETLLQAILRTNDKSTPNCADNTIQDSDFDVNRQIS